MDGARLMWIGLLASLLASLGTSVGALGIFSIRSMSAKIEDILLSAAAGVMLAASFFSLILPGMTYAEKQWGTTIGAALVVICGILAGSVALWLLHHYAPHEHFVLGREGPQATRLRRIWLFIIAITLHNFPEGMAVGVGFAGGNLPNGVTLAVGIGLQNIPEGLAVAAALVAINYSKWTAFTVASWTGLVEPIGGVIGSGALWIAEPLMPWILGFAAGAMLFIISDEIIPETHRRSFETHATFALIAGFVIMMFLDATLA